MKTITRIANLLLLIVGIIFFIILIWHIQPTHNGKMVKERIYQPVFFQNEFYLITDYNKWTDTYVLENGIPVDSRAIDSIIVPKGTRELTKNIRKDSYKRKNN